MLAHPVEGRLDDCITVAIPDFLSTLSNRMGGDVDTVELSHKFEFFKKWEGACPNLMFMSCSPGPTLYR